MLMKKAVNAPKGFHWMKAGKGFKLMKNPSTGDMKHIRVLLRKQALKFRRYIRND